MSIATELLHRLAEVGATVNTTGDKLVVRAGARRVPAELVNCIKAARAELLAVLSPSEAAWDPSVSEVGGADEATWWRQELHVRTIHQLVAGRTHDEAERLACGDLQNGWHRLHGKQFPFSQCAGCGEAIGGTPALDLGDGNRVHLDKIDCLIRYGDRWRGDATRALARMGLTLPDIENA
jgi:hypothetical protein